MGTVVDVNDGSLPEHVRGAFGATDDRAVPVVAGSGTGWLVTTPGGAVVLRPVADTALALTPRFCRYSRHSLILCRIIVHYIRPYSHLLCA